MPGSLNTQGVNVNVNNRLSDMDKAYMVINYNRNIPNSNAKEWTLEKALDVAGVPPSEQKNILAARGDSGTVRSYFMSWNKNAREEELGAEPASISSRY